MASEPSEPSKRPRLSSDVVEAYRRERIVRATAESAHVLGPRRVTVSDILRRCKMARSTFYSLFPTKNDALEYSCQAATDLLTKAVREAPRNGQRPPREVVIDSFIEAAQKEPLLTELCLLHSKSAPIAEPDRFLAAVIQALYHELGETPYAEFVALTIVQAVALQLARGSAADLSEVRDGLVRVTARPQEV